ncbi:hypothetical protein D9M72_401280 [compost metagenome]
MLVFELSAPDYAQALGQAGKTRHRSLPLLHEAGQVAPFHADLDYRKSLAVLMIDPYRALHALHLRQRGQWPHLAIGCRHLQAGEGFRHLTQALAATQDQRGAHRTLRHDTDPLALHLRAQQRLQRIAGKPGAADSGAVQRKREVLHALVAGRYHFGGAGDFAHACGDGLRSGIDGTEISAEHLDRHITARARQHFRDTHLDRLREAVHHAREALHDAANGNGDVFLAAAPLVLALEHEEGVGFVQPHRVEPEIVRAGACHDRADLRHLCHQRLLHPQIQVDRGPQ